MSRKLGFIFVAAVGLMALAACSQPAATPITIVQTVVVKETVVVTPAAATVITKEVPVIVTKEVQVVVPVEVEKQVVITQVVPVTREIRIVATAPVVVQPTPIQAVATPVPPAIPGPTPDLTNPKVNEVLNQITLVQHHHNIQTGVDTFSCASRGQGLNGVSINPAGPRFVGPNSMDFDLWGVVALFKVLPVFKVQPEGNIFLVPQQTGGKFVDPEGVEHYQFTLPEALALFASGDARWIGHHGEPGRIAECDPQFVTPTSTPQP